MKRTLLTTCLLAALPIAVQAKTITIGLDLSGSNPLLEHEYFAASAATFVADQVKSLETGDVVRIKSFGARYDPRNQPEIEVEISRRQRASAVADSVEKLIKSLPQRNVAQGSTNLIAWLEFTSGFDCDGAGHILVLTDALESSELIEGGWIAQGALPDPEVDLTGCSVQFYGLGAGFEPSTVRGIRKAWQAWMHQAGASFEAIIR